MRKMMVVAGILLAAGSLLLIISPATLVAGEIGCGTAVVTAVPHLNIRPLTCQEQRAVDRFLAEHSRGLSAENRSALRSALVTLLGIDQSHLPLTRTPAAYLADFQTVTQLLGRTVWKVKLPEAERPCSPPPAQTPVTVNMTVTGGGPSSAPLSAPLPVITGGQTIYTNTVMTAGWCSGGGSRTNITVTAQGGAGAAAAAASSSSSSTSSSTTPTSGASANNGSGSSSGAASP